MEYAAYPMPEDLPDYPSHWQIAQYFDDFVDHFGLRDRIRFRTEVVKVEPLAEFAYDVTVRGRNEHGEWSEPETRRYAHVVVANGHHWDPRWPEPSFPGAEDFPGAQIHAHYYKTPDMFAGKRVLVLGIGNSATDIAVESSRVAERTYLAMRRGAHIVPKFVFGVPTDHLTDGPLARMPTVVQQADAGRDAAGHPGQGHRLRPAPARPRGAARTPDGQRRPAHPARPRRPHRAAQHRPLRGLEGLLRRRVRPRGRRRRLLHRLQGELPVPRPTRRARAPTTTSTSTAAWWTPTTPGCTSSG